jgi:multidrug transporter EmrE-like cation transporter
MTSYLYLTLAFLFNSIGTVLVKIHALRGFQTQGKLINLIGHNIFFLVALAFFGLNLVMYGMALDKLPLSVAYPVMTVASFVIVSAFSFFYFRENIVLIQLFGYVLMLIGLVCVVGFAKKSNV